MVYYYYYYYYIVPELLLLLASFWCPCMTINVSIQYPDIILLTQCYPKLLCLMGYYITSGFAFTTTMFDGKLHCSPVLFLLVFWCPRMTFNVSIQYNGGLISDIILLTQCYPIL